MFKKGDLISGVDIESDCVGIIVDVNSKSDEAKVTWMRHWDSEMLNRTWVYSYEELKLFEGHENG